MNSISSRCGGFDLQPVGGYLKPKSFQATHLGGEEIPEKKSNLRPLVVKDAVWHLVDLASGTDPETAFSHAIEMAEAKGEGADARALVQRASGLSDDAIASVCRLSAYDYNDLWGKPQEPSAETLSQIREMAERGARFLEKHGPKSANGFVFGAGFTDDLAADPWVFTAGGTLWALKTSSSRLNKNDTLHILLHYLVGRHYIPEIGAVKSIGVYNARLDTAYTMSIAGIPRKTMQSVERDYVEAILSNRRPTRHFGFWFNLVRAAVIVICLLWILGLLLLMVI